MGTALISNPPYNMKWRLPPFAQIQKRFCDCELPPESNANYAFILTALSLIDDKAVFLLPCGALTTDNVQENILLGEYRQRLSAFLRESLGLEEMQLKLVKASMEFEPQITEMLEEWFSRETDITPYAIRRGDWRNFSHYLTTLEAGPDDPQLVPDSTFFCLDEKRNRMVGAVNIRHRLNERLLLNGGHIGDGVRPSLRGRGIGTRMVGLALAECRKLGLDRVLMVCDKDNIPSARTIQSNGGVLENEVVVDGVTQQRWWIQL